MSNRRRLWIALVGALPLNTGLADVAAPTDEMSYRPPQPPVSRTKPQQPILEVWVELTLPPTAGVPQAERAAHYLRIVEQQNQVMAELERLGAVERARVQHSRNAIAVRMPTDALDRARAISGVKTVQVVRHLRRSKP